MQTSEQSIQTTTTSQRPFLYLAPLRGITDVLFRNIFCSHFVGFDMAIAPFINPQRSPSKKKHLLADVLPEDNQKLPIIPQLLNNRPQEFLDLARRLEDLGYTTLNWNLGCPMPMVANKHRGSGLLPYPEEIRALLDQVMPKLRARLSVKMRLGYYHKQEIHILLPQLNDYPLAEIIIHPRLGKQMYKGHTDPDSVHDLLALTNHKVVYNGDINSAAIYRGLQQKFPEISSWMLGRGILMNPFLAEELKGDPEPDMEQKKQRIREFHNEIWQAYQHRLSGPGHLLGKMKQLWIYLACIFPGQEKVLKKMKKARNEQQFQAAVEMMLA